MIFVDTNYFLRFLLKDIDGQHIKARQLFEEAAFGKIELFTSVIVFFEIYWVLVSFYEKKKVDLAKILRDVLRMDFIKLQDRNLLQQTVSIFEKSNFDFEDVYNLVYARQNKAVDFKTFDKNLNKKFNKGLKS